MSFSRLIMAENVKTVAKSDDGEVAVRSQLMVEVGTSERTLCSDKKGNENKTSETCGKEDEIQPKEQELPELIRHKDESKGMMPCMPYINLSELATILRDPNMPSQKILKEVADKIMLKSEESESDDGSVSSGGGVVGMKGLLDCIFEVSYRHEDSASSDDDDSFERIPREIPCNFCNKIFGSTMTWNTHVLVAHAQLDSSVLNLRRLSTNDTDGKDKNVPQKKHTRFTPKSDCDAKDIKVRHTPAADRKHNIVSPHSESVPFRKRRSSFSKSQPKEDITGKSVHKDQSPACPNKKESPSKDNKNEKTPACDLVTRDEKVDRIVSQTEVVESVCADQPLDKADNCPGGSAEKKSRESLSGNSDGEPQVAEISSLDHSDQNRPDDTGKQQNSETVGDTVSVPPTTSTSNINLHESTQSGRKRKSAAPLPESVISSTASKPKCSKRNTEKKSVSTSEHKQSESSTEVTSSARRLRSRTSKSSQVKSSRGL